MSTNDPHPENARPAAPASSGTTTAATPRPEQPATVAPPPSGDKRLAKRVLLGGIGILVVAAVVFYGIPWLIEALNTESTDDAYVNGHVTFVAARVPGQVKEVLTDDNKRVRKGQVIVRLDPEPYIIQVEIKEAAVATAESDLRVATDQVRAMIATARSNRFKLQSAIDQVNNQVALLQSRIAIYTAKQAIMNRAKLDYDRVVTARKEKPEAYAQEEEDRRQQVYLSGKADVEQALADVYQVRAALGVPTKPAEGEKLDSVPKDLDQTNPSVRQALAMLLESAAPLAIFPSSYTATPSEVIAEFYKRDPQGNVDRIYAEVIRQAPTIQQYKAKLEQAERDLDQAHLNLTYCVVHAEIDGIVTRRNVNPGNNVQAGQSLMAVRSLTEIWIDANFKETQLRQLRIGQRARLEVDMYGSHYTFEGRITGFTMGTGSTLSLLPPQNATGNFVKIVQRLPVRIELTNYNPDKDPPLFLGLSVEPYVYFKEPPKGPNAGKVLQPYEPPSTQETKP